MSLVEMAQKNSPVGEKEQELLFLISLLDREDKVEFVQEFREDFEQQIEEKKLSKTGYYKLLRGYAPADNRVLEIVKMDEEAKKWVIQRVKAKAKKALEIIEKMEEAEEDE